MDVVKDSLTKPLLKSIESFASKRGLYYNDVLSSLLDYILSMFNIGHKPVAGWKYGDEENRLFYEMALQYFNLMSDALEHRSWYDMFGDFFMAWAADKRYRGQCFTPMDLCDLMAETTIGNKGEIEPSVHCGGFGKRVVVSDCACGSSRTLLAGHALFLANGWRKPYLIGEDLDAMCCKMSAVNMLVHGCYGEVVCHNTLTSPCSIMFGYVINEGMYPFSPGLPTVRLISEPEQSVACMAWLRRMRAEPQQKERKPVQLELF